MLHYNNSTWVRRYLKSGLPLKTTSSGKSYLYNGCPRITCTLDWFHLYNYMHYYILQCALLLLLEVISCCYFELFLNYKGKSGTNKRYNNTNYNLFSTEAFDNKYDIQSNTSKDVVMYIKECYIANAGIYLYLLVSF